VDRILDVLLDHRYHDLYELWDASYYVNPKSVARAVQLLRENGYDVRHKMQNTKKNGKYIYRSVYWIPNTRNHIDQWDCMINKKDWPKCSGQGCYLRKNCGAYKEYRRKCQNY